MASAEAEPKKDLEVGDSEPGEDDEQEEKEETTLFSGRSTMSVVWTVVALGGGTVNFLLAIFYQSIFILGCGICAVMLAGAVIHFQLELDDEDSLRDVANALRGQANKLSEANNVLTGNVNDLEGEVAKLNQAKDNLEVITKAQGANVDHFVGLVRQNGELLEKIKIAVRGRRTQLIAEAILTSDFDSSGFFAGTEIHLLLNNLKNVKGLIVNSNVLKQRVEKDGDLAAVLKLVNEMKDATIPEIQKTFYFDESRRID